MIFSSVDIFLTFSNIVVLGQHMWAASLLGILCGLVGYIGARSFDICEVGIYLIYRLYDLAASCMFFVTDKRPALGYYVLDILLLFVSMYWTFCVTRFHRSLRLHDANFEPLRLSVHQAVVEVNMV